MVHDLGRQHRLLVEVLSRGQEGEVVGAEVEDQAGEMERRPRFQQVESGESCEMSAGRLQAGQYRSGHRDI